MGVKSKSLSELIELMIEANKDVKEKELVLKRAGKVINMSDNVPESASYSPLEESKLDEARKEYEEIKEEIDRREKLYQK